jgi:hypothetical protein
VIYLETICKQAEGEGKYIRQTGGFGKAPHRAEQVGQGQ